LLQAASAGRSEWRWLFDAIPLIAVGVMLFVIVGALLG